MKIISFLKLQEFNISIVHIFQFLLILLSFFIYVVIISHKTYWLKLNKIGVFLSIILYFFYVWTRNTLTMLRILLISVICLFFYSCNALKPKKVDSRTTPVNAQERARKNIEEGRGASLGDLVGRGRGSTNYEFSTSNPMWRASLELLDFLPLTTVDYSGGMIITDWYSETNTNDSVKITIRFLANQIRSDSLKIIIHKKTCTSSSNCNVSLLKNSSIGNELLASILRKAAAFEKEVKNKKR